MKKEVIRTLAKSFEAFAHKTDGGIEFWLARDLQKLLGYVQWRNFTGVIEKAKEACLKSGEQASDHFVAVNKMVSIGSEAKKPIIDTMLTRYACYLIAQNGNPRIEKTAFAQTYFAVQTRKLEVIEQRIGDVERVSARKKLAATEKELSGVIFQQTGSAKNFGIIRSKGDKALFGYSTGEMKKKWNVPKSKPLADYAPTIILKAKDFAAEITIHNSKQHKMKSESKISSEHEANNKIVRNMLVQRGITPEKLKPEEDIKNIEKKLNETPKLSK